MDIFKGDYDNYDRNGKIWEIKTMLRRSMWRLFLSMNLRYLPTTVAVDSDEYYQVEGGLTDVVEEPLEAY